MILSFSTSDPNVFRSVRLCEGSLDSMREGGSSTLGVSKVFMAHLTLVKEQLPRHCQMGCAAVLLAKLKLLTFSGMSFASQLFIPL